MKTPLPVLSTPPSTPRRVIRMFGGHQYEPFEPSVDRSKWQLGPWTLEPDRVEFFHAGQPCVLQRALTPAEGGFWTGVVLILESHPWVVKTRPSVAPRWPGSQTIEGTLVHGGLAQLAQNIGVFGQHHFDHGTDDTDTALLSLMCLENRWVARFTCNMETDGTVFRGAPYRTMEYARSELCKLAEQARDGYPKGEFAWPT